MTRKTRALALLLLAVFASYGGGCGGGGESEPPVVSNARWEPDKIKKGEDATLMADARDEDCDLSGGEILVGDSGGTRIASSTIPETSSCGGSMSWSPSSSSLKEGSNKFTIWVEDRDGNESNKASATLKVEAACPSSTEVCDGKDNDCDGEADEGSSLCPSGQTCQGTSGCVTPPAEVCDGKDNDGDGQTDEGANICPSGKKCSGTAGCVAIEDPMAIPIAGLTEGQAVSTRVQVISGTVPASIRSSVTQGRISITNTLGATDTDFTPSTTDGSFSQRVELTSGNNTIDGSFRNSSASVVGRLKRITIVNNIPPLDIRVRLVWNTDKNDLDLHVKDPNAEEVYYTQIAQLEIL